MILQKQNNMTTTETTELGFNVDIAVPKRPDKWSKEVQEVAAVKVAELLKDYWKSDGGIDDKEALWCAEEIVDNSDYDGYKLARFCDDRWSWDADSDLVDTLDGVWAIVHKATGKAVEKWVKDYNVTVPYEVGQRVHFKKSVYSSTLGGEVKSINTEMATLTIKGDDCTKPHTIGYIIPVEDVLGRI